MPKESKNPPSVSAGDALAPQPPLAVEAAALAAELRASRYDAHGDCCDDGEDAVPCGSAICARDYKAEQLLLRLAAALRAEAPVLAPSPEAGLTLEEIITIREAVRSLDCGHLHCRYCAAGSPAWAHSEHCPYRRSVEIAEQARAILDRLQAAPVLAVPPPPTPAESVAMPRSVLVALAGDDAEKQQLLSAWDRENELRHAAEEKLAAAPASLPPPTETEENEEGTGSR